MSNLQLYKRQDSKEKGRHLIATQNIRKNQLILVERPLLFLQSLGNTHQGALVCRQCGAFIGGPDICLAVASGRLKRENVWEFYNNNNNCDYECGHEGYEMVSCRNKCGELFCSNECEKDFWMSGGHDLMCTGLIPDPVSETSENENQAEAQEKEDVKAKQQGHEVEAEQRQIEDEVHESVILQKDYSNESDIHHQGDESQSGSYINLEEQPHTGESDEDGAAEYENQEEEMMHPLIKFKVHAVQSNEIFLMVGDLVASVISMRKRQIENQILAKEQGIEVKLCNNLEDLLAPYLDFTLVPWWDVATNPMMLDSNSDEAAIEYLDTTLRDLCSTSAKLLKDAISTQLVESPEGEQCTKGELLRSSSLQQAIKECEEKYNIFSAKFFGQIIGSFEQNALGVRGRHPLCRDIIEDQSLRKRRKADIIKCLQNAGMMEVGDEQSSLDNEADTCLSDLDRNLASLYINEDGCPEEGNPNNIAEIDGEEVYSCDKSHGCEDCDSVECKNLDEPDDNGEDQKDSGDSQGDDLDLLFTPLDGTAHYYTTCKMNHSCTPNVIVKYSYSCSGGGKYVRWGKNFPLAVSCCALKDIKAGEELCISYINEDMDYEGRVKALENYGFVCICEKCVRQKNGSQSLESGPILLDEMFPEEDDIFPEEDDLFAEDNESCEPDRAVAVSGDFEGTKALEELEMDLNLKFSAVASDSIPINIVAPTISSILNLGKSAQRDFCQDSAYDDIVKLLKIIVKSFEDRNYVKTLETALEGEKSLFGILQTKKVWPTSAHRDGHQFFSLAGALGFAFTSNFVPAMQLIDKAVVLGLSGMHFRKFIKYVELHRSDLNTRMGYQEVRFIPNFQQPHLKDLVLNEGLNTPIKFPIEEKNSDYPHELFLEKHFSPSKPVVIRGFARTWPAVEKWR